MRYVSETVLREAFTAGTADPYGNPLESWGTPQSVGIYAFNPGTTAEPFLPGHDRVITLPTIYAPTGTVFGARDRVTVRGVKYEVVGVVLDYRNPYDSSMDGVQVNLEAVTG